MKTISFIWVSIFLPLSLSAQLITTTPAIPVDNQPVTIVFDATQGDAGLIGYGGSDVYAYTGVLTDLSSSNSNWRYVKESAWLDNQPSCLMTKLSVNKYQLVISPSIRAFYGVPDAEKILKMTFVFRNADGSRSGRGPGGADIFVPVFTHGLNVGFNLPADKFSIVPNNQKIQINITAGLDDSICLFLDKVKIKSVTDTSLIDSVYASGTNLHTLLAVAYKDTLSVADSVSYLVQGEPQNLAMPPGLHDGINYIDDNTVSFVLFAPYKKFIYLLGDFNDWTADNSTNLMNRDSNDTSRYWITIHNLEKSKEYLFQYLIDGTIRIADPYCEKISDPWNDQYIPSAVYPGLISYPYSKTNGIAGVIQTAQSTYNWQVTNFVPPDKNKLVIYELLIRDFTSNRDIKTLTDTIGYLKRLGVNAVELMPFNEFDGNDSWGYNPCFYFAPDKAYGTRDDYKKFIDVCHANGMAVIQDMVLDFSTNNSPLVQMYFANGKPTAQNPWYDVNSPNTAYVFGNVFNHSSPYTKKLTDSITSFWMQQYKVDGFRFDFAKGWTNTVGDGWAYDATRISNFKEVSDHMWSLNPKAYVILELFTDNTEENELSNYGMMIWDNANCPYNQASMGFSTGSCAWDFSYVASKNLGWSQPNAIGYMESHDEERLMYKNLTYGNSSGSYNVKDLFTAIKRMEEVSCFFYTIPGPKMLWQFGELGYDVTINYDSRTAMKPIHWEYYQDVNRRQLYDVTSSLIKLKETEPVFSTSTYTLDVANTVKQITLTDTATEVHIIGNFDVVNEAGTIHFSNTGTWYEYFRGDSISISAKDYLMNLKPGEFHIYSNRKLTDYGSLVFTKLPEIEAGKDLSIYPNPFSNDLFIDYAGQKAEIEIISIEGNVLIKQDLPADKRINLSCLQKGIYILRIQGQNGGIISRKIIKI